MHVWTGTLHASTTTDLADVWLHSQLKTGSVSARLLLNFMVVVGYNPEEKVDVDMDVFNKLINDEQNA